MRGGVREAKNVRVLHISIADGGGGAARAAQRIHSALRRHGVDSQMLVVQKLTDDSTVHELPSRRSDWITRAVSRRILRLRRAEARVQSLNVFPSGVLRSIEALCPDVVNLHWVGGNAMSIGEIGRVTRPVVWTLHDMWAFSGVDHYEFPSSPGRYRMGYSRPSRSLHDHGLDLDRWVYLYKRWRWRRQTFHFISPSHWLAGCLRGSSLLGRHAVHVVPNCVDTTVFRRTERRLARERLELPFGKRLLLFGAVASTSDRRKGYAYLLDALESLASCAEASDVELVVFGSGERRRQTVAGFTVHHVGNLDNDGALAMLYSASDLFIAPSVQDNLPNTLVESLSCGTRCVGFAVGGIPDLIPDERYGVLVKELTGTALAAGIVRGLSWADRQPLDMSRYSEESVAAAYVDVFRGALRHD